MRWDRSTGRERESYLASISSDPRWDPVDFFVQSRENSSACTWHWSKRQSQPCGMSEIVSRDRCQYRWSSMFSTNVFQERNDRLRLCVCEERRFSLEFGHSRFHHLVWHWFECPLSLPQTSIDLVVVRFSKGSSGRRSQWKNCSRESKERFTWDGTGQSTQRTFLMAS